MFPAKIMKAVIRVFRKKDGQAVVELAFILPVIILIVFGITEFGRAISAYLVIQNAAREAVRLGITGASDGEIESRVLQMTSTLEGVDDPNRISVDVQPGSSQRVPGTDLKVTVTYWFNIVVPVISNLVGEQIKLTSSLAMQI